MSRRSESTGGDVILGGAHGGSGVQEAGIHLSTSVRDWTIGFAITTVPLVATAALFLVASVASAQTPVAASACDVSQTNPLGVFGSGATCRLQARTDTVETSVTVPAGLPPASTTIVVTRTTTVTPGCGGEADRVCYAVTGVVTRDGRPVFAPISVQEVLTAALGPGHENLPIVPRAIATVPDPNRIQQSEDSDRDGVIDSISVGWTVIAIDRSGSLIFAPSEPLPGVESTIPIDPRDDDPTFPIPREDAAPVANVAPVPADLDRVRYTVGAQYTLAGQSIGQVLTGEVHLDRLPMTLPAVPSGPPVLGALDLDGDGVPAFAEVPMQVVTIGGDGSPSAVAAPGVRVPVDPDDADATFPRPRVDEQVLEVTPRCGAELDRVCVRAGVVFTHAGVSYGRLVEESRDLGALPAVVGPVPAGLPAVGADSDGDGVPDSISIPMHTIEIAADGTPWAFSDAPRVEFVDPAPADPTTPLPRVDEQVLNVGPCPGNLDAICVEAGVVFTHLGAQHGQIVRESREIPPTEPAPARAGATPPGVAIGCAPDAVCVTGGVRASALDQSAGKDVDERASLAPVTEPAGEALGWSPIRVRPGAAIVRGPPAAGGTGSTPSVDEGTYAQRVNVGSAQVSLPCPGNGHVGTPTVQTSGVVARRVLSYEVRELPPIATVRCAAAGAASGEQAIAPP